MTKIFGIGLNKTGTKTLGTCFRIFGFRNMSFDLHLLQEYAVGNLSAIFKVSDSYDTFEDWPWPLLYKEFDQRYPDAKFILTLRKDPQAWFESLCRHAERTGPTKARELVYHHAMPHHHREDHLSIYSRHNDDVLKYFKGRHGKLLQVCWEDGDEWEKLAVFLGLPVPGTPFPHENPSPGHPSSEP